jgi:hydrogenase-4 component E
VNGSVFVDIVNFAAGAVLVCAIVTLWRQDLLSIVSALRLQGIALGIVAGTLAIRDHDIGLAITAGVVLLAKGALIPTLLRNVVRRDPGSGETAPLINVPASLVSAAVLTVIAFLASSKLTALYSSNVSRLAPIGISTVLVGFLVLVTRRKAVSQIVGLLLLDNGIALVAFLLTAGVPFIVECGATLDVLLVAVVLRLLATTMQVRHGSVDLDQLRELHD